MSRLPNTISRIINKYVHKTETCWFWTANFDKDGYGYVTYQGPCVRAPRLFYEKFKDTIPKGYDVHHTCKNRACVNPDHLELILHTEHRRKKHRRDQNGT